MADEDENMGDIDDEKTIEERKDEKLYITNDLPVAFTNESLKEYYVRKCYDVYYQLIIDRLNKYKYLSVTGTPGM